MQEQLLKSTNETFRSIVKEKEEELAAIVSKNAGMSPAERQMQAVLGDDWYWKAGFFASGSEKTRLPLVIIDKSFFDPKLPRETIQFITVYWAWNEKTAPTVELIRQFKQNFDFEALKQMLGK